jgi:hypothetical protein
VHRRARAMGPALFCGGAVAVVLAVIGLTPTTTAARSRAVFFLKGEQLVSVTRGGVSVADAVRELLAGPSTAETARGLRSYVPRGTLLRRVFVGHGLGTVDVSRHFAVGGRVDSRLARLAQLVRTVSGPNTALPVQLLVEGRKVSGVFPGVPTASPITYRYLQTPSVPVPRPPTAKRSAFNTALRDVQRRLIALHYLAAGGADGINGPKTQEALVAFQKWERLPRTGVVDARTRARLSKASSPTPVSRGVGSRRIEVLLDRQLALLIDRNRVVSAIAVSTGKPSTPTPPGHYRVYAKIPRWWSTPFREWLPWAVPFVGGIAFHEYLNVPAYAASHGCIRQVPAVARITYNFASVGMPIAVIARSYGRLREQLRSWRAG